MKPAALTIGEVYDSTGALLPYYPDQLDAYFAFEVADSIIAAVQTGSARGLVAPALRLAREVPSQRWSPFLRNHDQPRTITELSGSVARARVAATLLLTMPGLPFVYYGEELGMTGAKPDERIRTPKSWTRGPRHASFTTGTPWQPMQDDSLVANVAGDDVIVVIANVGTSTARDVTVTAGRGAVPVGRRATRDILLGGAGPPVAVDSRGVGNLCASRPFRR